MMTIPGCYSVSNGPKEALLLRFTKDTVEVLNVESLSTFAPLDSLAAESRPEPMLTVSPAYPKYAHNRQMEGTVWVKVYVTTGGNVKKAYILKSDDPIFNEPALNAAVLWQFRPAVRNGEAVAAWVSIPFKFRLYH